MSNSIQCPPCNDRLDELINTTDLTEQEVLSLRAPHQSKKATITISKDDGSTEEFNAFRVLYNNVRGPGKGGLRFHPSVNEAEVTELAFLMALKTALADIPMGGGKGGIAVDPKKLSESELERLSRAYIRAFADVLGPDIDVPAPDIGTNPEIMALMLDEYETIVQQKSPAVITGKPISLGGSLGRDSATGRGAYYVLRERFKSEDKTPRVAIQGFGNAGIHLAQLLAEDNFTIVALSDSAGAIYNENGIDIKKAVEHKQGKQSISEFRDAEKITNEELLSLDVDALVPAALGNVITKDNAETVRADVIVEVANAAVSAEADQILQKNATEVIPDVLANAGGVIVSYFEWAQNKEGEQWSEERVNKKLEEKMVKNWKHIQNISEQSNLSIRAVSYVEAIKRINTADKNLEKDIQ